MSLSLSSQSLNSIASRRRNPYFSPYTHSCFLSKICATVYMARRFTDSKKAKGPAGSSAHVRRIQIPPTDNSALIEMNKLTLIGRVTNPEMQNTRALVDFFLQHWQVAGTITGCDLGPYPFQFSSDLERDLQSILLRGPYHLKKWTFMLQRWEPIVSENFPSSISFLIRIHGIPLHYWTEQALQDI